MKNIPSWMLPGAIFFVLLLLVDTIGSTETIVNYFGISSVMSAGIFFILLIVSKIIFNWTLNSSWSKVFLIFGLSALISAAVLIISEFLTPVNYIYTLTKLNPSQLLIIVHFLLGLYLLGQSQDWWRRNLSKVVLILPIWILFISFLVRLLPFDAFVPYSQEDGVIENTQFLVLIATAYLCFKEVRHDFSTSKKKRGYFFVFLLVAFLVVALEEISWGQRIFGWSTPEVLKEINVQDETTIHNIGILNQLQLVGYIGISFIGATFSLLRRSQPWKETDYFWYPQPGSFLSFLIIFVFYLYFTFFDRGVHSWTEMMELLLYLILFFWVFRGVRQGEFLKGGR